MPLKGNMMIKQFMVLAALSLAACGGAPEGEAASFTEALHPHTTHMNVRIGTHIPPGITGTLNLSADPNNDTTVQGVAVTRDVTEPIVGGGIYRTTVPNRAFLTVVPADYFALIDLLNTPGKQTLVTFTYDNDTVGIDKTVFNSIHFGFVP